MKTGHFFVVAEDKVRDKILIAYAEAAERLWTDTAADLPFLEGAFNGRRMLIVLADEEEQARRFGEWQGNHAKRAGVSSSSYGLGKYTIASFSLGSELAEKNGLLASGRLFRLDAKEAQNLRLTWPQRIHFLSSTIITSALRSVRSNEGCSFSMFRLSYAYHREFTICGKIETEVTYGGGEDIEGFKNGRNWADPTRRIIALGRGPSIEDYLKKSGSDASARDLGFGHGLLCFVHHDPQRLAKFGKMLEVAVKDKKCPDAKGFCKALGYDSVSAFDVAWLEFMKSDSFE